MYNILMHICCLFCLFYNITGYLSKAANTGISLLRYFTVPLFYWCNTHLLRHCNVPLFLLPTLHVQILLFFAYVQQVFFSFHYYLSHLKREQKFSICGNYQTNWKYIVKCKLHDIIILIVISFKMFQPFM
jgi:hypothetical protein